MKRHRYTNSTGTINISGSTSGGTFKSKLECYAFIRAFFADHVESVKLQQPVISYLDPEGETRRYTGDLLVEFHPSVKRRPLVVECKYDAVLKKDADLVRKLKCVEHSLNSKGYDFVTQTEKDVKQKDLMMMRFVFDHINNDPHRATDRILECMTTHRSLRLGELTKAVCNDRIGGYQLIPEVWRLVARRKLAVDFQQTLDLSAKISLSVGMSS